MNTVVAKLVFTFIAAGIFFVQPLAAQTYVFGRTSLPAGKRPSAAIAADFNRDGKPDLAVANFGVNYEAPMNNTVSIMIGAENGAFAPQVVYATASCPCELVSADFNGDGKPDLAVLGCDSVRKLSILLGNGDGTFQSHVDYDANWLSGLVAGDFNGDGCSDVALLGSNSVVVLYGSRDGSLQPKVEFDVGAHPLTLAVGDFNGDGRVDLITNNMDDLSVTVLLSTSGHAFTRKDCSLGLQDNRASYLALGDFNRDGQLDAAMVDNYPPPGLTIQGILSRVLLLKGKGDGTFEAPTCIAQFTEQNMDEHILAGDLDGDGILDLALNGYMLKGKGDGTFVRVPVLAVGTPHTLADVNQDSILDWIAPQTGGDVINISLGNGDGSFSRVKSLPFAQNTQEPLSATAADFNGDGKLDVASAFNGSPEGLLSVRLGNGDGTFQHPQIAPLHFSWSMDNRDMLSADFNGDGKADLLLMGAWGGILHIWLSKGDGTFQAPVDTDLHARDKVRISIADVNSDGKSDLIVAASEETSTYYFVQIFLSKGDGTFQPGAVLVSKANEQRCAVGDFNRDGAEDVVLYASGFPLRAYPGKGDGTFSDPIYGPDLSDLYRPEFAVADLNGDHNLDLLASSTDSTEGYNGKHALLIGNGDGTFQKTTSPEAYHVDYIGDFDGDGKLDLVDKVAGRIWLGNGDGTLGTTLYLPITGNAAGDFDSDGRTDLAVPVADNPYQLLPERNVIFYLSGNSTVHPDFQLVADPDATKVIDGSSLSASVLAGHSATYRILVVPSHGFQNTVSFSCSGLPAGAFCDLTTVSLTGKYAVGLTVTVRTTASLNASSISPVSPAHRGRTYMPSLAAVLLFGGVLTGVEARRSRKALIVAVLLMALMVGMVACGGGGSSAGNPSSNPGTSTPVTTTPTPAGTYTIVLNATSGQLTRSINLTLTVI